MEVDRVRREIEMHQRFGDQQYVMPLLGVQEEEMLSSGARFSLVLPLCKVSISLCSVRLVTSQFAARQCTGRADTTQNLEGIHPTGPSGPTLPADVPSGTGYASLNPAIRAQVCDMPKSVRKFVQRY